MRCCDISQFQGVVNFDQLRTGVNAVIIRAGYSGGGVDTQFARNKAEARRVGLPLGYYWFAYPDRIGAAADADKFLDVVGDLRPGEILVLDYEVNAGGTTWCKQFLDRVRAQTGVKALLYTNQNRVVTLDWSAVKAADHSLWVAIFDNDPNSDVYTAGWSYIMKQYTADGRLPGISGPVDLDEFYGTVETFYKYGYQGGDNSMPTLTTREDLDFLYASNIGRSRGPGEGEDVYLGKDYRFVDQDTYNSAEARKRREQSQASIIQMQSQLTLLQDAVTNLASRPTKDQLQAALATVEDLAAKLQIAQDKLNNLPAPIPPPSPATDLEDYSFGDLVGAAFKKIWRTK